jgi:hypothetical protein
MPKLVYTDWLDIKRVIQEGTTGEPAGQVSAQVQVPVDQWWEIERMTIRTNSVAGSTFFVYTGSSNPQDEDLVDGSSSGNLDVADNNSPARAFPGQIVTFRWTGLTAGSVAKVHANGKILTRQFGAGEKQPRPDRAIEGLEALQFQP